MRRPAERRCNGGRRLRRGTSRAGEAGQITAMLVLLTVCLVLAIAAVTDISAAYLRRQSATSLADGAALSVSDAAAAAGVYGGHDDEYVAIDEVSAEAAVEAYLHEVGAQRDFPGLSVQVTVVDRTVTVALSMPFALPVPVPGAQDTARISATSSAVLPIY